MFRRFFAGGSSSSQSLWKPKNPHSTEYLKYLHSVLTKNQTVTEGNKGLLVEALRAIAEILIWGDQNDPGVFDLFLERNMLSFFLKIMRQTASPYVCVQLLQTLNILFENIRNQTSIYYLLSNNHVNSIIEHKFDFSDEEVMAYYISFLKTLSLKLTQQTIHFFYNEHTRDFPLYTEAIKFFNHPESMVRIAVRTLTLNVFRVEDRSMQGFVRDTTAAPYFGNLVYFIANHVVEVDKLIKEASNEIASPYKTAMLSTLLHEHLDHLHYLADILELKNEMLSKLLIEHLLDQLINPVIIQSLITNSPSGGGNGKISKILGLYVLCQLFKTMRSQELLDKVLAAMEMEKEGPPMIDLVPFLDVKETDYVAYQCLSLVEQLSFYSPTTFMEREKETLLPSFLNIATSSVISPTPTIRIVTVQLTTRLIMKCVRTGGSNGDNPSACSPLSKERLEILENARRQNISQLKIYMKTEEMFLEMFEDEYTKSVQKKVFFHDDDAVMLLPPVASPLSGVKELERRRPCGETERVRQSMRIFFHLRHLILTLKNETEPYLPLTNLHRHSTVQLEQAIDLTNSDLLACTVVTTKDAPKLRRFLVVDNYQLILVEPSPKRMGWGVVKFVGYLQDLEVHPDPSGSDPRILQITVKSSPVMKSSSGSLLTAKFVFDDHIRCMAAGQRLNRGRTRARDRKLTLITRFLLNDPPTSQKPHSPPTALRSTSSEPQRYHPIARNLPGLAVVATGSSSSPSCSQSPRHNPPPEPSRSKSNSPRRGRKDTSNSSSNKEQQQEEYDLGRSESTMSVEEETSFMESRRNTGDVFDV